MNKPENEYTMQLLAGMVGKIIAQKKGISNIEGFDAFMQSKTAEILFDDEYILWHDGPAYIANEYFVEMGE